MVIGVTGGIGSGKSTVLNVLKEEYDALVIEADAVAKELRKPGTKVYDFMVSLLGQEILSGDGSIDNSIAAKILFNDTKKLDKINKLLHPMVKEQICTIIKENPDRIIAVEAALFIEAGYMNICDKLWVVYCNTQKRVKRLVKERGYTAEKAKQIISLQLTDDEFKRYADEIIDNSNSFEETAMQVSKILCKYREG